MEHADIRREFAACVDALLAPGEQLPKPLRPYQIETAAKTRDWLQDPGGTQRAYVHHATGLGKTVEFASFIRYAVGLRALIIAPSKILIEQTARVIAPYVGGMVGHLSSLGDIRDEQGVIIATRGHAHQSVVITTDATLRNHAREIATDFSPHIIFRDECHWGYTNKSQQALARFPKAVIIGFSATPDYLTTIAKPGFRRVALPHGQTLYANPKWIAREHFGECLDVRTAHWGMEQGWLCPLAWIPLSLNASLDGVPVKEGPGGLDYDDAALFNRLREYWHVVCEAISTMYRSDVYGIRTRQAFAVCPSVAAAKFLAEKIASLGIRAACITGETPERERQNVLRDFDNRRIRFLSSVQVLREGWDAPVAEICFMLRPRRSLTAYEQPVGRVLRPFEDGTPKVALAVDISFDRTQRFLPLSAPLVYGEPGETIAHGDLIVRPIGGTIPQSPYRANNPPLVVVPTFEVEYWANEDGTFETEHGLWANTDALAVRFETSRLDILRVICRPGMPVRRRQGKPRSRREHETFYLLRDVERNFFHAQALETAAACG